MHPSLSFMPNNDERLGIEKLRAWLWSAADTLRGVVEAPNYKDFILPLIFYKRLSDVFDDELVHYMKGNSNVEAVRADIESEHVDALKHGRRGIVRFYIPEQYDWRAFRNHPADGTLGQFMMTALHEVARLNPELEGILTLEDYDTHRDGRRAVEDSHLVNLITVLSKYRLGLRNVESGILASAYKFLFRKLAHHGVEEVLEFATPRTVVQLMIALLNPTPANSIYDPACGTGELLVEASRRCYQQYGQLASPPRLYGQEIDTSTLTIAKANLLLYGFSGANLAEGNTFRTPSFLNADGSLRQFDYVATDPPRGRRQHEEHFYQNDPWNRFSYGIPPQSSSDWAWVQHILASLNNRGRAVTVLGIGSAFRGSNSQSANRERDIRRALIESDVVEAVVRLPSNLFYNISIPSAIFVLNKAKPVHRRGKVLLVNASKYAMKQGRDIVIMEEGINAVEQVCRAWQEHAQLSHILTLDELRSADYNLDPASVVVQTPQPPFTLDMPLHSMRIFVSHSHKDNTYCHAIVQGLRSAGADVWYDEHNMQPGQLGPSIERELLQRPIFVLVLSPSAVKSSWVENETRWAYGLYRKDSTRVILPVTAESVSEDNIWLFLREFMRIEAGDSQPYSANEAVPRLVQALRLSQLQQ